MVLNHLAHLRLRGSALWQNVSEALPGVFVDPDGRALAVAANAYARVMLRHDGALAAIARWARLLAARQVLDGRECALLANGYSKLRLRDDELMELLATRVMEIAPQLGKIDIANIVNAYARLAFPNTQLFAVLRTPILDNMGRFREQHFASIAHGFGRLRERDEVVLERMAGELWRQCDGGRPVAAVFLPSIVHAYAVKLGFVPPDLVRVVEFSLPRVVAQMEGRDLVLTVPSLPLLSGLVPTEDFRRHVFGHCLSALDSLTGFAVVSFLETAARLHHLSDEFWEPALRHCVASIERESWPPRRLASLALAIVEGRNALAGGAPPPFSESAFQAVMSTVAEASLHALEGFELRPLADLATAFAHAGVSDERLNDGLARRAHELLCASTEAEAYSEACREAHDESRLRSALVALGAREPVHD